jgi:hypothetical protein
MRSPTSITTEKNPEPRRLGGPGARGTPLAATATDDIVDAACSDERPSRRGPSWPSEALPTGVLSGVLGELAFYYGACWLYHLSTPPRRGRRQ